MAGAGIDFLSPLTDLKPVSVPDTLMNELKQHNASNYSQRDKILVDFVWVTFFLSLAAWMYSVFLSFPAHHASYSWAPPLIGCAVFLISWSCPKSKSGYDGPSDRIGSCLDRNPCGLRQGFCKLALWAFSQDEQQTAAKLRYPLLTKAGNVRAVIEQLSEKQQPSAAEGDSQN
jgi:hypothetical protein